MAVNDSDAKPGCQACRVGSEANGVTNPAPSTAEAGKLAALEAENARLVALLEAIGTAWGPSSAAEEPSQAVPPSYVY